MSILSNHDPHSQQGPTTRQAAPSHIAEKKLSLKYRLVIFFSSISLLLSLIMHIYVIFFAPAKTIDSSPLRRKIQDLEQEFSKVQSDNDAKLKSKDLELSQIMKKNSDSKNRINEIELDLPSINQNIEFANKDRARLEDGYGKAVKMFDEIQLENSKLKSSIEENQMLLDEAKAANQSLSNSYTDLGKKLDEHIANREKMRGEINAIYREHSSQKVTIKNLEKRKPENFFSNHFDDCYLKFYNNPQEFTLEKLNETFAHVKKLIPDEFFPAESAQELFCEHMKHLYFLALAINDFRINQVVKEKLKFCPGCEILTDPIKGLEDHIRTYVSRKFIYSGLIANKDDSFLLIKSRPYFLTKCVLLLSSLTGRKVQLTNLGEPTKYSYTKIYKFPFIPQPSDKDYYDFNYDYLNESFDPSAFFPFEIRNVLRLSFDSRGPYKGSYRSSHDYSSLRSLYSDNLKFQLWLSKQTSNPGPIRNFLEKCNEFFDYMIDSEYNDLNDLRTKEIDLKSFNEKLTILRNSIPPAPPEHTDEFELVLKLLPPMIVQQFQEIHFRNYQKRFWAKLASQHSDSLLAFLPKEIQDVPFEKASHKLFELINTLNLSKETPLSKGHPFYYILGFDKYPSSGYNSESYNFLLLKCLYCRAKFHDPKRFSKDSDAFAKSHSYITPKASDSSAEKKY
jgi:hypothetical protein